MTDFLIYWADYWDQLNNQSSETSKLQGILAQNDDYQQLKVGDTLWVIIQGNKKIADNDWLLLQRIHIKSIDNTGSSWWFQGDSKSCTFSIDYGQRPDFSPILHELDFARNKTVESLQTPVALSEAGGTLLLKYSRRLYQANKTCTDCGLPIHSFPRLEPGRCGNCQKRYQWENKICAWCGRSQAEVQPGKNGWPVCDPCLNEIINAHTSIFSKTVGQYRLSENSI